MEPWEKEFIAWCRDHDLQAMLLEGNVIKITGNECPPMDCLKGIIPEQFKPVFERGPKEDSKLLVTRMLRNMGYKNIKIDCNQDGALIASVVGSEKDSYLGNKLMAMIREVAKDRFIMEVRLNYMEKGPDIVFGQSSKPTGSSCQACPSCGSASTDERPTVVQGKRGRDDIITKDEVTDLKIRLGLANTVEDFLKEMETL